MKQLFDHTTPQDIKRHLVADEMYTSTRGCFQILMLLSGGQILKPVPEGSSITVPAGTCHMVQPAGIGIFTGTAQKTKESTYANGGKQAGKLCALYEGCRFAAVCEQARLERKNTIESGNYE